MTTLEIIEAITSLSRDWEIKDIFRAEINRLRDILNYQITKEMISQGMALTGKDFSKKE